MPSDSLNSRQLGKPEVSQKRGSGKSQKFTDIGASTCFSHVASLLPAASQCFIQLNQSQQLIELGLYNPKLGREGVGFVGQDFEIASDAPAIAQVREARGVLCGLEQEFFLRPEFSCLAMCDQGVGYAAEGALNCLLVEKQGRLLLRFRQANIRTDSSRSENRLGDRCAKVPSTGGTAEQVGKRRRLEASAPAK